MLNTSTVVHIKLFIRKVLEGVSTCKIVLLVKKKWIPIPATHSLTTSDFPRVARLLSNTVTFFVLFRSITTLTNAHCHVSASLPEMLVLCSAFINVAVAVLFKNYNVAHTIKIYAESSVHRTPHGHISLYSNAAHVKPSQALYC